MAETDYARLKRRYPPSCRMGYTTADLERYFGAKAGEPHPLFDQLEGQTGAICEGEKCDEPHGFVAYTHDVLEWRLGKPVSDW